MYKYFQYLLPTTVHYSSFVFNISKKQNCGTVFWFKNILQANIVNLKGLQKQLILKIFSPYISTDTPSIWFRKPYLQLRHILVLLETINFSKPKTFPVYLVYTLLPYPLDPPPPPKHNFFYYKEKQQQLVLKKRLNINRREYTSRAW